MAAVKHKSIGNESVLQRIGEVKVQMGAFRHFNRREVAR